MIKVRAVILSSAALLALPALAHAQAAAPPTDHSYINVDVGAQVKSQTFSTTGDFPIYDETATFTSQVKTKSGVLMNIEGGMRVWHNLFVGVAYSQRFKTTHDSAVTASVPHPLFYDSPREAASTVPGLQNTEADFHISLSWRVAVADHLDVRLFGGPSFFNVKQDFVTAVAIQEDGAPYSTVSITGGTTTRASKTAPGFNLGLDATYMFSRRVGAGILVRVLAREGRPRGRGRPDGFGQRRRPRSRARRAHPVLAIMRTRHFHRSKWSGLMIKKSMVLGLALAFAAACGGSSKTPTSPSVAASGTVGATSDSVTLKASAPTPTSPIGKVRLETLTPALTVTNATAAFASVKLQHQFQVMDAAGKIVADSGAVTSGSSKTSYTLTTELEGDKTYTWRARAVYQGHYGPWSSSASFLTPELRAYIRGAELYDPLTDGETVGTIVGPANFVPGVGLRLGSQLSHVDYRLPETLTAGEFSVMITGIDEGSPGDKSKVMSMQEDSGDIITNDYRFTVELRGRDYPSPGMIVFRIITGDASNEGAIADAQRSQPSKNMSDERWYFWKATWDIGWARVEVREDGPTGAIIWGQTVRTNGHPYRPVPHVIHLGAPVGRSGAPAASIPGATYKNVWVSARPRPTFPQ